MNYCYRQRYKSEGCLCPSPHFLLTSYDWKDFPSCTPFTVYSYKNKKEATTTATTLNTDGLSFSWIFGGWDSYSANPLSFLSKTDGKVSWHASLFFRDWKPACIICTLNIFYNLQMTNWSVCALWLCSAFIIKMCGKIIDDFNCQQKWSLFSCIIMK